MKKFTLITFASDVLLARAVAREWLDVVEKSSHDRHTQCVALSGGRIAREFFNAVAEGARVRSISLAQVHFFWADERCVPPTDPESNFAVADKLLFQPLSIPRKNIHRIHGEGSPDKSALAASNELQRMVAADKEGLPKLDLVFLGMGEDGHIASLFPGDTISPGDSREIYRAVIASKPPPHRITLSYGVIAAARAVWVLASGAGKEQALYQSLSGVDGPPLGRLLAMRQGTRIFTDVNANPGSECDGSGSNSARC